MRMKRFAILLAAVAIVVITWSIAWFTGARLIDQSIKLHASASPQVTCGELTVRGYPFRFDVACRKAQIVENDISISLPELRATVLVYRPTHLLAFAQGPAQLVDNFSGSQSTVQWKALSASAKTNWLKLNRFSIVAEEVDYKDTLFGDELIAAGDHIEVHLVDIKTAQDENEINVGLFANIKNAILPAIQTADLNANLDLTITRLPDDMRSWLLPNSVQTWALSNGDATINHLNIKTPDVTANLKGKLQIEPTGLLAGELFLTSSGLAQQMDSILPPPYGRLVVGTEQADGSFEQDLKIDAGIVRVGNIPLAQLDPLF